MKYKSTIGVFLVMLVFALSPKAFSQADPNFHIYLCFGQSNMEGQGPIEAQDQTVDARFRVMQAVNCSGQPQNTWRTATPPIARCNTKLGPSDYFGREMVKNLPSNIRIGIVHVSIAGSKIEIFDKNNYQAYLNGLSANDQYIKNIANEYGGNPYARLVALAKLAQQDGVIKGILLHQGESNTNDQAWPTKVKGVYTNLLTDLGLTANNVPLLAGQVVDAAQGGLCASMNTIINSLPNTIPTAHIISSSGCTDQSDNLHFTSAGYRTLGIRYAQMMLSLLGTSTGTSPVVSLTAPTAASFTAPASITITATATDSDGTIANVKFYNGTTLLSTISVSPYTYTWTNVVAGTYSITAVATDNSGASTTSAAKSITVTGTSAAGPIGKCKGKYFGNIIANSVPSTYNTYWNQVTSENASKWASVEGTQGTYNWAGSDVAYNWAKNNGGLFKYHAFVWGQQAPGWVTNSSTSVATIRAGVENYIKACSTHYTPMGGLKMIDVLNEPVNTPMPGNMKAALTAGYKAEPANAGDLNNPYGWVIWPFQLARKYFPDAVLLINEYNVEMNWNSCRGPYIDMANAVKNAPNLTDGKKNLIDGVGLQCHGIGDLTAANFKACIDEIWNKTGLPIHITEFDQEANPNESKQQAVYSSLIPVAWEHPHVAGITLWGYIQGTTWRNGNGQSGANGTDSGIMYANGTPRPALNWLVNYMAGKPSLSCCPAPAPFGACSATTPVVSITSPLNNASYTEGDNIIITATATIATGSISKVEFYNGSTLLGSDATSPYEYTWNSVAPGSYQITAKATSAANETGSSLVTTVLVTKAVFQSGSAPTIDGTIDAVWSNYTSVTISNVNTGTVSSAADLSGSWKAMWDATNLYVLVEVTDDVKRNDAGTDVYNDDGVEIYVDFGNTKAADYGANDHQYTFRWNDATAVYEINGHSVTGITKGIASTTTGYIVEVKIPWTTIGGTPTVNSLQGFEVMLNDDDDGAARDGKKAWIATTDDTWDNPSLMGTIVLKGLNCTPPTATITTTTPTTFCAGGSVVLTASAGTGYTYVWKKDNAEITGATTATYSTNASGSYTVTITSGGCSATSVATAVTVNALPTAAITAGGPTTFVQGGSVVLTASAGSSYIWRNGTTQVGTGASYTATASGSYTVEVTNTSGCMATSAATVVTVNPNQPSMVTITSPASNSTVTTLPVTITVSVSDPDGSITKVEFLDGNTVIGTSTTAPYSFEWNNPADGTHTITVRVTDSNGGVTTSSPVTVTTTITTGSYSPAARELKGMVYPVPARDEVMVETEQDLSGATFNILNVLGEEMEVAVSVAGKNARLNVTGLSEGAYILVIRQDASVFTRKITVMK